MMGVKMGEGIRLADAQVRSVGANLVQTCYVLFLCAGNYYRSRYAEELFNHYARVEHLAWQAVSRGLAERGSPENVGPMSRLVIEALQERAISPAGAARYPQPCSLADFEQAALVIGLKEAEHRPMLERRFPKVAGRVRYWHIHDIGFEPPATALALIEDRVNELVSELRFPGA